MEKSSNQRETIAENQRLITQKRVKKVVGHLDPSSPPVVCPIKDVLANVTDKWSLTIILVLGGTGTMRFNELKRTIAGISAKVLTERLKRMERDGYLVRSVYPEVPIRVQYHLSEFGLGYLNQVLNMSEWVIQETPEILRNRTQFDMLLPH